MIVAVLAGPLRVAAATDNPLNAVVEIRSAVPGDARTAESLGTARVGGGVLIDAGGLILTIGYLVMESDEIWVTDAAANRVPAEMVAYDHETGFGLLRALGTLDAVPARLGRTDDLSAGATLLAAGPGFARSTVLVGIRPFAGGWEYLLEEALYTSPPIPNFGGAALFAADGRLVGIGSLILGDVGGGLPGNLYVPIDLLPPILGDLLAFGRSTAPAQPWLGLYPNEVDGALVVDRVARGGPAQTAGIGPGDVILGIDGEPVSEMEQLWRKVRGLGAAGVEVPVKVLSGTGVRDVTLTSRDRRTWLKLERSY
jgi:S1-C subfamily serine protease